MEYLVTGEEMREIDRFTIEEIGIDALVLMERAALQTAECVKELCAGRDGAVLCICGTGNNGGDGVAVARLLTLAGIDVAYYMVGDPEHGSRELKRQFSIAEKLSVRRISGCPEIGQLKQYAVIVDAIFGTGLNRDVTGAAAELMERINASKVPVAAVDIPSGVDAASGRIFHTAVRAAVTVTFGVKKLGLCLYPGAEYAGEIRTVEIGFPKLAVEQVCGAQTFRHLTFSDLRSLLPERREDSNKGTYGKVLIIAGCDQMTGAAVLAAEGSYRMGAGLVKVLTSSEGVHIVRTRLPEALTGERQADGKELARLLEWADSVVIGPGMGTGEEAGRLLDLVLSLVRKPLVLDADALNLLAKNLDQAELSGRARMGALAEKLPEGTVLTPHKRELARLTGCPIEEISGHLIDITAECTYNNKLVFVLKDARTIIAAGTERFLNLSGNQGMSTGGSGDVLAGLLGGLLAVEMPSSRAACLGVFLHGLAGDLAAQKKSKRGMLAGDILEGLTRLLLKIEQS